MANPHADLEKLEKAYTADPEPKCWCGSPLVHIDTYGDMSEQWRHETSDPMYAHAYNLWRNRGDADVLLAVEEIRTLRRQVEEAYTHLETIRHCAETIQVYSATYSPDLDAIIAEAQTALGELSAEPAQKEKAHV